MKLFTVKSILNYIYCSNYYRMPLVFATVQGKHRQTRKYYSSYNALLEIKELMLKETSLLNSIISQVFIGELHHAVKFILTSSL